MFIVTWDHHGVWLIEAVIKLSSFGEETMEMLVYDVGSCLVLLLLVTLWYALWVFREGFNICDDQFLYYLSITSVPILLRILFLFPCSLLFQGNHCVFCSSVLRKENG